MKLVDRTYSVPPEDDEIIKDMIDLIIDWRLNKHPILNYPKMLMEYGNALRKLDLVERLDTIKRHKKKILKR